MRQRESNDADSEAPRRIKAVDELRSMNVKQLGEEASIRGVSAAGTKKELVESLCAGGGNDASDNDQDGGRNENSHPCYLSDDILVKIFSYLPTKCVGRCRCLSKEFRRQLSKPTFITSHLSGQARQESLFVVSDSGSFHYIASIKENTVSKKLNLSNSGEDVVGLCNGLDFLVVGSCDGLVFLVNEEEDEMVLVNPTTLHRVKIPNIPMDLKKEEKSSLFGLGYDTHLDDYKVVMLSGIGYECYIRTVVDTYSVKSGVWKKGDISPYYIYLDEHCHGVFVNGALHWLGSTRESGLPCMIVAFRLTDEKFDEISIPSFGKGGYARSSALVLVGGCLCMLAYPSPGYIGVDVWIMNEYGCANSWTKINIDLGSGEEISKPICFISDEQVVLLTEELDLVVYNMKDESFNDMIVDGVRASFMNGCIFFESLVSPAPTPTPTPTPTPGGAYSQIE